MHSTIATHNFGQMQHAEYESQVARYATTAMTTKKYSVSMILGTVSTILHQAWAQIAQSGNHKAAVNV